MAFHLNKSKFSWYFPVFFVVIVSIGTIASLYVYQSVGASLRKSLIYRAETIALALNAQNIQDLEGDDSDVNRPEYQEIKKRLMNIREANKDSRFVYVMGKNKEEELYFVADSEDPESEDYSPPGQVYFEESPAFENAFSSKASGSEGPTADRWGSWITGVAPVLDEKGTVIAAVGIDVDAYRFNEQLVTYTLMPAIATLILIVFVYLGIRLRRQEHEFLEVKSKFIAIASHDIRSPLTGLSWAMQSLVGSPRLQPEDRRLASEIADQVQHLLVTANDILDALSVDMPKHHILKTHLKLRDIVSQSVDSIRFFARQEQIRIVEASIPDTATVDGDLGKLQQLFINVLSNAIKYSHPHADVVVEYACDERWHFITVIDKGIGIPYEEQKLVFKGFYRAQNAERRSVHGTGLGLYLVKRIAELHGGKIDLVSEQDKGTTVKVVLPRSDRGGIV